MKDIFLESSPRERVPCAATCGPHLSVCFQGDARQRRVSRMVEEVQSVMLQLTTQISSWDCRFHSISNSGVHSDNLKVRP